MRLENGTDSPSELDPFGHPSISSHRQSRWLEKGPERTEAPTRRASEWALVRDQPTRLRVELVSNGGAS